MSRLTMSQPVRQLHRVTLPTRCPGRADNPGMHTSTDRNLKPAPGAPGGTMQVTDFQVAYCNAAACRVLNADRQQVLGSSVLQTPLMDPVSRERIFEQCLRVWHDGEPVEFTYHSPFFDRYFNVQRSRVNEGILSITRDRTELVRTQMEKDRQGQLLNNLIEKSPYGVALYESVRDGQGGIVDFRLKVANAKSAQMTGFTLQELYRYTVTQLIAMRKGTSHFFEICRQVVEKGQEQYLEYYSQHLDKWIAYSITPFADGYLLNYIDISPVKSQQLANHGQAQLLESILNASQNGIFAYTAIRDQLGQVVDFEILKVNESFSRILGISQQQAVGRRYSSVFPGILDSEFFTLNRRVLQSGQPARTELYYRSDTIDGWFDVSITPLGENGLVQTFSDITQSRSDKQAIERSAFQLQTVIDSTQTGIFLASPVFDEGGRIVDFRFKTVNTALASYGSHTVPEMTGRLHGECFPVYFTNGVFEKYRQVWLSGQPLRFEQNYLTDRHDVWMDVSAIRLNEDLLVTFHDFTPVKMLQHRQESLMSDLKLSNQRLSEFAQVASHDMKEPLRKIRTYATLLGKQFAQPLGPTGTAYLERIQNASERMQLLIGDILSYSQTSSLKMDRKPVFLPAIVGEVWADLETAVEQAQAAIDLSGIQTGPTPVLMADPTRFRQLFQNLLSNALKFRHSDRATRIRLTHRVCTGKELKLHPAMGSQGAAGEREPLGESSQIIEQIPQWNAQATYHLIQVADNGIGFDPGYSEQIFSLFQRLHTREEYEGNGLGLSLCKQIVEQHQGVIRADSKEGQGAVFTIVIPVV